jgi:cytochrome P450
MDTTIEASLYRNEHPVSTDIDISSSAFWSLPFAERERSFARLRAEAPVSWHRPVEVPYAHEEAGYWAVTRADDITAVSMNPGVFRSGYGIQYTPQPPALGPRQGFFLTMDGPEHATYRALVSAAFTPAAIRSITHRIERDAAAIIDDLPAAGDVDFVEACAARLPMATVSDIIGVPASLRGEVARAAEYFVSGGAPGETPAGEQFKFRMKQAHYLFQVGADLAGHRRKTPGDDLMTSLVEAEVDGARLTNEDIGQWMLLISVAGNDTTRQTIAHTARSLYGAPEQKAWLTEDFDGRIMQAIDEFVRHATPVMQFARTAAVDTELSGAHIAAGDKVVVFYCSGNRDDRVFGHPEIFDLRRPRVRHVAFGGGGPHYCLGSGVAGAQLRAIFRQLLTRVPDIEFGQPVPLVSNFINGFVSLPARIGRLRRQPADGTGGEFPRHRADVLRPGGRGDQAQPPDLVLKRAGPAEDVRRLLAAGAAHRGRNGQFQPAGLGGGLQLRSGEPAPGKPATGRFDRFTWHLTTQRQRGVTYLGDAPYQLRFRVTDQAAGAASPPQRLAHAGHRVGQIPPDAAQRSHGCQVTCCLPGNAAGGDGHPGENEGDRDVLQERSRREPGACSRWPHQPADAECEEGELVSRIARAPAGPRCQQPHPPPQRPVLRASADPPEQDCRHRHGRPQVGIHDQQVRGSRTCRVHGGDEVGCLRPRHDREQGDERDHGERCARMTPREP